jgi:outer membrane protein assembly factor BamB
MPSRRHVLDGSLSLLALLAGCTSRDEIRNSTTSPGDGTTPEATDPDTDTPDTSTPSDDSGLAGPWPTFRGDAANTGVVAASGPTTDPSLLWRTRTRLDADACPIPAPEGAYVPSGDGHLYALTDDGEERWRAEIGRRPWTPAVEDDKIIVPTHDALVAFDPDGTVLWKYDGEGFFQQPAFLGETVVAGRFGGGAVLIDVNDGTRLGRVGGQARAYEPVVRDETAYVGLNDQRDRTGAVVAVAPDGSVRWRAETDDGVTSRIGVGGGTVYAGTNGGHVYAFDAATGERQWRASVGEWVTRGPTVVDGRVFAVTLRNGLVALDGDGSVLWRATEVDSSTDPVVVGGRLLCDHDHAEVVALDPTDGSLDWRFPIDGQIHQGLRAVGDRVVAGTATGTVHEIDPRSGEEHWRFTTKPRRFPSPVIGQRFAYLGSRSDYTSGIVLEKGKGKWSVGHPGWSPDAPAVVGSVVVSGSRGGDLNATEAYTYPDVPTEFTPTPTEEQGTTVHVDPAQEKEAWTTSLNAGVRSSVSFGDGAVIVGTEDGLAAVEISSGQVRWRAPRDGPVESTPAIADGVAVAGANDGSVAAHALADGTEQWTTATGDRVVSSPAVRDGAAYVGSDDGSLYAFELADGTTRWEFETGGPVVSSPAATPAVVVVGSADGTVYAVDSATGERRWTFETGGPVYSSPAIADGAVYVGSRDGHLYALGLADGRERWRFEASNWVDSSPVVAFGTVFVADQGGNVYALVD